MNPLLHEQRPSPARQSSSSRLADLDDGTRPSARVKRWQVTGRALLGVRRLHAVIKGSSTGWRSWVSFA